MKSVSTSTNKDNVYNIYIPNGITQPITIMLSNSDNNDNKVIKIINNSNSNTPQIINNSIKTIRNNKYPHKIQKEEDNDLEVVQKITKPFFRQSTPESITTGAKKYCDFLVNLCEDKIEFIDANDSKKNRIGLGYKLVNFNSQNKYFWHYGPLVDGYHTHRDLKIYTDNNIVLGFKQAQKIMKEKGYKLLDISNPGKSHNFYVIITTLDQVIEDENIELWHGLNKLD